MNNKKQLFWGMLVLVFLWVTSLSSFLYLSEDSGHSNHLTAITEEIFHVIGLYRLGELLETHMNSFGSNFIFVVLFISGLVFVFNTISKQKK